MFAPLTFPGSAFSAIMDALHIVLCLFYVFCASLCCGYLIFLRLYGIIYIVTNAEPGRKER